MMLSAAKFSAAFHTRPSASLVRAVACMPRNSISCKIAIRPQRSLIVSKSFHTSRVVKMPAEPPKTDASIKTDPVHAKIAKDISAHKVVLYMKGVPEQPMCGFSRDVVRMLNAAGADYVAYNVLDSPELREGIKKFSNWPTIPQLFVGGEFIGGRDITFSLYQSGELRDLLLKNSAVVPEMLEEVKKQQKEAQKK